MRPREFELLSYTQNDRHLKEGLFRFRNLLLFSVDHYEDSKAEVLSQTEDLILYPSHTRN